VDDFGKLRQTWKILGEDDPLWAVVSHDEKRGGRWDLAEFLATGERDVERCAKLVERHTAKTPPFEHALDFGCGVGRLSKAWSARARKVTGVDISNPMISNGRELMRDTPNVTLTLNERPDLGLFPDGAFDLVFSLICLQHMPWKIARGYVQEFARVCGRDGVVVFQLPARRRKRFSMGQFRMRMVESLPFGLDQVYRKWRRGSRAAFKMYCTPAAEVERVARSSGLALAHKEPDDSAGSDMESFLYIFRPAPKLD
jgi:ubiquinone/menaquinone biosynthesis C-methylase UbiE